ncbi:MAG: hypothetical protein C3F17_10090 [Bradyrhizobiaceae bacterium]|nr:MAG: hypothetical protein C3F17_10090 [Bradyrhizobiaceae bacterium]
MPRIFSAVVLTFVTVPPRLQDRSVRLALWIGLLDFDLDVRILHETPTAHESRRHRRPLVRVAVARILTLQFLSSSIQVRCKRPVQLGLLFELRPLPLVQVDGLPQRSASCRVNGSFLLAQSSSGELDPTGLHTLLFGCERAQFGGLLPQEVGATAAGTRSCRLVCDRSRVFLGSSLGLVSMRGLETRGSALLFGCGGKALAHILLDCRDLLCVVARALEPRILVACVCA